MSAGVRGQALIINNYDFGDSGHEKREGSQLDVEKLRTLFSELSFKVGTAYLSGRSMYIVQCNCGYILRPERYALRSMYTM